jgi:hypothetical protein
MPRKLQEIRQRIISVETFDSLLPWLATIIAGGAGTVTSFSAWIAGRAFFEIVFYGLGAAAFAAAFLQIISIRREYSEIRGKVFLNTMELSAWRYNEKTNAHEVKFKFNIANMSPGTVEFKIEKLEFVIDGKLFKAKEHSSHHGIIAPQTWVAIVTDYFDCPEIYRDNDEARLVFNVNKPKDENVIRVEQDINVEYFPKEKQIGVSINKLTYARRSVD